ncbi:hypothetical protein GGX14DRAFT_398447 [Mycena pura]|uniref:Uncharacterized protein n=1 Tax=Mycena pura TaxID=153505 RepID=A0AAD6VA82_9AGAR|nr:hypothetical protein GGX14DRAFT_398447 [Mycena pura]
MYVYFQCKSRQSSRTDPEYSDPESDESDFDPADLGEASDTETHPINAHYDLIMTSTPPMPPHLAWQLHLGTAPRRPHYRGEGALVCAEVERRGDGPGRARRRRAGFGCRRRQEVECEVQPGADQDAEGDQTRARRGRGARGEASLDGGGWGITAHGWTLAMGSGWGTCTCTPVLRRSEWIYSQHDAGSIARMQIAIWSDMPGFEVHVTTSGCNLHWVIRRQPSPPCTLRRCRPSLTEGPRPSLWYGSIWLMSVELGRGLASRPGIITVTLCPMLTSAGEGRQAIIMKRISTNSAD